MENMIDRERLVEILRAIKEDIKKPLYMDNLSDIINSREMLENALKRYSDAIESLIYEFGC